MSQEEQDRLLKAFCEYAVRESKAITFMDYIPIIVVVVGLITTICLIINI